MGLPQFAWACCQPGAAPSQLSHITEMTQVDAPCANDKPFQHFQSKKKKRFFPFSFILFQKEKWTKRIWMGPNQKHLKIKEMQCLDCPELKCWLTQIHFLQTFQSHFFLRFHLFIHIWDWKNVKAINTVRKQRSHFQPSSTYWAS